MAERYKLPDALGGGEVDLVIKRAGDPDWWSVCVQPDGPQFEIHQNWLTPVKPPTPEEPEPGPYWVGDYYVVHAMTNRDKRWGIVGYPSIDWVDWPELLDFVGPDVTITRLVPERVETVELPWESRFDDGDPVRVELSVASNRAAYVSGWAHLTAAQCDGMAAALLTAAAASRAES